MMLLDALLGHHEEVGAHGVIEEQPVWRGFNPQVSRRRRRRARTACWFSPQGRRPCSKLPRLMAAVASKAARLTTCRTRPRIGIILCRGLGDPRFRGRARSGNYPQGSPDRVRSEVYRMPKAGLTSRGRS